jgi:hypothetical protein
MNGLTNTFLTILLGWLRSLFNAVWALLSSDGTGSAVGFLRSQWKTVFLVLCVGGFVVDRLVYLIRWRPYYVWTSKRRARRRKRQPSARVRASIENEPLPPADELYSASATEPQQEEFPGETVRYQPPVRNSTPGFAPAYRFASQAADRASTPSYTPEPPQADALFEDTQSYPSPTGGDPYTFAPAAANAPTVAYGTPFRPSAAPEKSLDEPENQSDWQEPQAGFQDFAPRVSSVAEPEAEPAHALGHRVARLQNEQYLRDVRSGFAPPAKPEDLYALDEDFPSGEPIHPGLDLQMFQQNIGLHPPTEQGGNDFDAQAEYPNFTPFSVTSSQGALADKPRMLGTLAKKARNFVGGEDENNPPTIRDLQTTVDVTNAFHAPVYPKKNPESREE